MNSDKCHLILSSNDENKKIELNGEAINNTQVQKLLGVHIDYKLKYDTHIESLCKKIGKNALAINRNIQSKKRGCTRNNNTNFQIQRPFI